MTAAARLLLPVLFSLLALAGCGQRDAGTAVAATPAASTTGKPLAGGELIFAFDGAAVTQFSLDPHNLPYAPHHRVIRSIFDSLVVALPGHRFGPWLATSWDISPDGRVYTFHLRDDVSFHDGTRFDAAAVKVNLDRISNPKNALMGALDVGPYDSSIVVDPFTVRVQLKRAYAPLLANLSKSSLGMVSPAAVAKFGDQFAVHPVGTGPFKFKSLQAGTEVVLERNADYRWGPAGATHEGPAWLDRLVFKNVPEEATRVAVLQNGQAGAADLIPPQNLVQLRNDARFRLVQGELLNMNYALFLNTDREPWNDPKARAAFKQSLDVGQAVKAIYLGTLDRAWSPLSPSLIGYDKTLEGSWRFDRAAAARALDDLGWRVGADGIRTKAGKRLAVGFLDTQGNREKRLDLVTLFRRQLKDNGIELRIDSQPQGAFMEKVIDGDFDLLGGSLFAPDSDVLRRVLSPAGRGRYAVSRIDDPELNKLLDDASTATDDATRVQLYQKAQRLIVERSYVIPIYVLVYTIATAAKVHGVEVDTHGFPVFYDAWIGS